MTSMQQRAAQILGIVFLIVGILGFFTAPVLGLFQTDMLHNVVHLVSGIILLWAGFSSHGASVTSERVLGVIYAVVTIWGFVALGSLSSVISSNMADNYLHLVLAVVLLGLGYSAATVTGTAKRA